MHQRWVRNHYTFGPGVMLIPCSSVSLMIPDPQPKPYHLPAKAGPSFELGLDRAALRGSGRPLK